MTKSINTQRINAIFAKADNAQAELATQLFNEGIFNRTDAHPHVIAFCATKYGEKPYTGQRGLTFKKDSPAYQSVKRILNNCFERVTKPRTSVNKADPVKSLVTRFTSLTAAEKRRFLASI